MSRKISSYLQKIQYRAPLILFIYLFFHNLVGGAGMQSPRSMCPYIVIAILDFQHQRHHDKLSYM